MRFYTNILNEIASIFDIDQWGNKEFDNTFQTMTNNIEASVLKGININLNKKIIWVPTDIPENFYKNDNNIHLQTERDTLVITTKIKKDYYDITGGWKGHISDEEFTSLYNILKSGTINTIIIKKLIKNQNNEVNLYYTSTQELPGCIIIDNLNTLDMPNLSDGKMSNILQGIFSMALGGYSLTRVKDKLGSFDITSGNVEISRLGGMDFAKLITCTILMCKRRSKERSYIEIGLHESITDFEISGIGNLMKMFSVNYLHPEKSSEDGFLLCITRGMRFSGKNAATSKNSYYNLNIKLSGSLNSDIKTILFSQSYLGGPQCGKVNIDLHNLTISEDNTEIVLKKYSTGKISFIDNIYNYNYTLMLPNQTCENVIVSIDGEDLLNPKSKIIGSGNIAPRINFEFNMPTNKFNIIMQDFENIMNDFLKKLDYKNFQNIVFKITQSEWKEYCYDFAEELYNYNKTFFKNPLLNNKILFIKE